MIFLPLIVAPDMPYVNEWQTQIFIDIGAHMEDLDWAVAWNYMDPTPSLSKLNPLWYFEAKDGYLIEYVNYILFEDHSYHWWGELPDEEEVCFGDACYTRWGQKAVQIRSDLDIDVIIVKVKDDPDYCPTCIPSWKP